MSKGRAAWNIVTSLNGEVMNMGTNEVVITINGMTAQMNLWRLS